MAFRISYSTPLPVSNNFGLYAQTEIGNVITGTSPQSLIGNGVGTLFVPAKNFLVGDSFCAEFSGRVSAKNNEKIKIVVYSETPGGDVILATTGEVELPLINSEIYNLVIYFTIQNTGLPGFASLVSSGEFHFTKSSNGNQQGFSFLSVNNSTFDTTIQNKLKVEANWSSPAVENGIQNFTFVLNKIY